MTSKKRAVLVISEPATDTTARCLRHCDDQGHRVVAVISDDHDRWREAHALLATGEADVLVIADPDASHVEVAGQQRRAASAANRRPRYT